MTSRKQLRRNFTVTTAFINIKDLPWPFRFHVASARIRYKRNGISSFVSISIPLDPANRLQPTSPPRHHQCPNRLLASSLPMPIRSMMSQWKMQVALSSLLLLLLRKVNSLAVVIPQ
ncbi:hypothetical protein B9Z55_008775 [Caenorhabditis nigoni]|uniref:Uncharacterized protein n=1 Tax=Caenorhabditis nigoni TaxID=1611254 RepID=A0A2G5UP21_9PELO|nr:hypothetical protein B9Z55_008775 [Caenorhabditis nigoni]